MIRIRKLRALLFLAVVSSSLAAHGWNNDEDPEETSANERVDDATEEPALLGEDGVIELNPGYVDPASDATGRKVGKRRMRKRRRKGAKEDGRQDMVENFEVDDDNEDEEAEDEEENDEVKSLIDKALSKSKNAPRRTLRLVKKHRNQIMIGLALFAFRREISALLLRLVSTTQSDPETGETIRRVNVSPTNLIKIWLFIDVMRRMQSPSSNEDANRRKLPMLALFGRGPGGVFAHLLSELLHPTNTAFVPPVEQHYTFEKVNDRYQKDGMALKKAMGSSLSRRVGLMTGSTTNATGIKKSQFGVRSAVGGLNATAVAKLLMASSESGGEASSSGGGYNGTVIIMDLHGWTSSEKQLEGLRDEVSFLLGEHRDRYQSPTDDVNVTNTTVDAVPVYPTPNSTEGTVSTTVAREHDPNELEIIILLESPGGSASDFGLASQQIGRLRNEPGVKVTICVDKVAASGGYMMACMSSPRSLFAAPFALLGSIGVIGSTVNVHQTLQNWGMKPLVFRGGKDKAPVGTIGEVTKEGLAKVQDMVDKTHYAFKRHVVQARPGMARHIDEVATGDVWLGYDALGVGLIDRVVTSDEYIGERLRDGARVLKLMKFAKSKFPFSPPRASRDILSPAGGGVGASFRSLAKMVYDGRRIMSKLADLLDDVPRRSEDLSFGASARAALGVTNAKATACGW